MLNSQPHDNLDESHPTFVAIITTTTTIIIGISTGMKTGFVLGNLSKPNL
jgi:cell shape-determining protein MreD